MHTYRYRKNKGVWTVGFGLKGAVHLIRDFKTESSAAAFTSYLNGGQRPAWISVDEPPEGRDVLRADEKVD